MENSKEQQAAIDNCHKNLYISSGPGSGKSHVISEIAKRLVSNLDNIVMLVTFTNKASREILYRANASEASNISGGTFHKISYKLMKSFGKSVIICDENKKRLIIKKVFNCKRDREKFDEVYKGISKVKSSYPVVQSSMLKEYQRELSKYNMVDFDDIINHGIDFLKERKPTFKLTHILVDELQDTSQNQLELLKELQRLTSCNMIGVADGDQSLYEWRNAKPENVKNFIDVFNCEVYTLGLNFRSDKAIVKHSRRLIEHNKDRLQKDLRANSNDAGIVKVHKAWNIFNEIDKVVDIYRTTTDNITVLYRDRLNKMKLEYGLRKVGIEYVINDSSEIVERSSFRVLLSMLRISAGAYDIYDLEEASKGLKNIGPTTVAKVRNALRNDEIDNVVFDLMNKSGTRNLTIINQLRAQYKRLEKEHSTLDVLVNKLPNYVIPSFEIPSIMIRFLTDICKIYHVTIQDIRDICNDFGLDNTREEQEKKDYRLSLSTIHNAKGSEEDIVIMPFCNWEIKNDENTKDVIEAERRVFYVGMTRAKHQLHLIYSGLFKPKFISQAGL
jgi:DNA helicase-2/ATP-dependent DNA helicase PcrA